MRKIEVCAYQREWNDLFEREATNIQKILKGELLETHHIGSTSVNGMKAKPVIDIMVTVQNIDQIEKYNPSMAIIGYQSKGENGLAGRRYFEKGGDQRTHHVHIYQAGNPEVVRHIAFRDYLRSHPEVAKQYSDVKQDLANRFPYDAESYINGKAPLVSEIEKQALAWYRSINENNF